MTFLTFVTNLIPKKGEKNYLSDDIKHVMISYIVLGIERNNAFFTFP